MELLTGDLPLPPLPSFSLPAVPPTSLLPLLDFCIIWTSSHSCRHACHKMKKHQEPKHWLLQGRNENIKLIVLSVLTLAWSFHVWVADKFINYTSFLHLTCSNQGFQTLGCPAQQWSWPSIFWGNHSILGKHLSVFLIPILIRSDFTRFPFLRKQYGLEGIGVQCDSSHLSWPCHSCMCFASTSQITKLQGTLPTDLVFFSFSI